MSTLLQIASYTVEQNLAHDRSCFTEGLFIDGGHLYESCGLYKKSRLRAEAKTP